MFADVLLMGTNDSAAAGIGAAFMAMWAAMMGFMWLFYCFMLLLGILAFVVWLWMLIDCLKREDYDAENEKLLWALVVIFAGIIGAALYYFLVKRKKEKAMAPEEPEPPKEETVP
jgi:prolipoprotein diacylglyceryltransferase